MGGHPPLRGVGFPPSWSSNDHLTNVQIRGLKSQRLNSRAELLLELLTEFYHGAALSKNTSFRYFMRKTEADGELQ